MPRFLSPAALLGLVFLTGCSWFGSDDAPPPKGGFVVGDEPYAVQAGAEVLAEGGTAADAATATYFALSATYPVAAGIGGGGICLVHDQKTAQTQAFSFLPRQAAGGGAYAVPGAVRGFALLQATYGHLPWPRDVSPGEGFAATGFPISHALATRISQSQDVIRLDAALSAEFLSEAGTVKPPGTIVSNPELGQTLSIIRRDGPDGFYLGGIAQKIAAYSTAEGGAIKDSDLANYTPDREDAPSVTIGSLSIYIPPTELGSGKFVQSVLAQLTGNPSGDIVGAMKASMVQFKVGDLPKDLGATGFAANDAAGQSVACAVTMNGPFGSGHTAAGTGVTLANSPSTSFGISGAFLTPVIATGSDGALALAGSGTGGPDGTGAILFALMGLATGTDVSQRGTAHTTGVAPYETVNMIACPGGVCATVADSGGNGIGIASRP